jgi:hypothetical protein
MAPFRHLLRLSDGTGLLEHARRSVPRRDLGYTTDDTARGLIAVCRQPDPGPELVRLAEIYLVFLAHARDLGRGFRNRLTYQRVWTEENRSDDATGRAMWALGSAATSGPTPQVQQAARALMEQSLDFRSAQVRPSAYLILGCAELLGVESGHQPARRAIEEAVAVLGLEPATANWPWREDRLTYENARIPEAILAAGAALFRPRLTKAGFSLLRWLVGVETRGDHFSFVPVRGWVQGESRPAFDQQPIEAAAMADACARAWDVSGDPFWQKQVERAAAWFLGDNDARVPLYDPDTQGCCDGLEAAGVNRNQGAESTLAMITTFQQVHRIAR